MKKYLPFVLVLVVVAVGAGFLLTRDSNGTADKKAASVAPPASSTSSNSSNATTNPVAATTDKVSISNFAFSAAKISVKMGTKVTWTNNDSVAHTVTADSGTGPKSDNISPGGTYSYTFDSVGTFAYHCNIHPDMIGTVTVTQ